MKPPDGKHWSFWLLAVMTACFCVFVLSLPVFPTEDGPIHLYFATVLGDLLSHSSSLYAQFYYVHHLLPPYSLQYYLLIVFMKFVSAPMAEKLLVCLTLVNFAFGFRYLATGIGKAGEIVSLLVVALLFNWPLGMGFENFSLSLGMACWALGIWFRLRSSLGQPAARYRLSFVLLLALMTLTHPVPVVVSVGFAAFDFEARILSERFWRKVVEPRKKKLADLYTLIVGGSTLGYISFYADTKRSIAEVKQPHVPLAEFFHYAKLFGLAYFGGESAGAAVYRGALYLILILGLFLGISATAKQWRRREWSPQISWTAAVLLLMPALCFLPQDINGSHFFAERLVIFVWLAALAAACGYPQLSRISTFMLTAVAIGMTALVLGMSQAYLRPMARQLAELETQSVARYGQVGLLLPANREVYDFRRPLAFYPAMWAGTSYFRRSASVLLNTPWMDLPILPLGARAPLLTDTVPFAQLEDYQYLREALTASSASRPNILTRTDFILFAGPGPRPAQAIIEPILKSAAPPSFSCLQRSWFVLCQR